MRLSFALCTDENFVTPALVCITSIFENNMDDECHVTILTEGLDDTSIEKFNTLARCYNQTIDVIPIDSSIFDSMVTRGRYPRSMYFRFLLPEILKDDNYTLYLDCDIMVRRPLRQLFQTDLDGLAGAAVVDQQCDDIQIANRLRIMSDYFNSGVMLMNLEEWRDKGYSKIIIEFIEKNPSICIYPDQDALNVVLDGKMKYLDLNYNLQEMWLTMLDYARFSHCRYSGLIKAKEDPSIVHFCVGDKPWYTECRNPYVNEYLKYASIHKFIGFQQRNHYSRIYFFLEAQIMRLRRWQKKFMKK